MISQRLRSLCALGSLCFVLALIVGCSQSEPVSSDAVAARDASNGSAAKAKDAKNAPVRERHFAEETKALEAGEAAVDELAQDAAAEAPATAEPANEYEVSALAASAPAPIAGKAVAESLERRASVSRQIAPLSPADAPLGDREADRDDLGVGPGQGGDKYASITDNPFQEVAQNPLSTFSIDVDTASYSKVRMYLTQAGHLPPPEAVRIEELLNYFDYDYGQPQGDDPFAANVEVTVCPWKPEHRLARIGIQGKEMANEERPLSNLVFLLDVSGSMNQANKLPLVKEGMRLLLTQLGENDRVAIVVYAGAAGLVLPSTPCDQQEAIHAALDRLQAGGSTNGGEGILLAYQTAADNYIEGGVNRVVLCTDGDFNVGQTSNGGLAALAEEKAKSGVFLSVLGFGMGNHNDAMLEEISNKGNGNYAFIDTEREARKVLVEQAAGTLVTIAKDVKIQIEFNPAQVAAYRLIGYENRLLAAEDFNDDKKDAGEIGAGHTVTALYEIVPAGIETATAVRSVDPLKYQSVRTATDAAASNELLTLKIRYKQPDGDTSKLLEFPIADDEKPFGQAGSEMKFAAAVASFGMLLRDSEHRGATSYDAVLEIAADGAQNDKHGYRQEFLEMIRRAKELSQR
ncbi:MAG: VWA domain-containing protein [Planctomycetales bacterium]|nr:VWA domain-containing protein [Planctomycetales bacterium]